MPRAHTYYDRSMLKNNNYMFYYCGLQKIMKKKNFIHCTQSCILKFELLQEMLKT